MGGKVLEKIFISHATKDADLAASLMDFLQTQYGLTRKHFFLTSDEEFSTGDKWIDIIEKEMNNAKIIIPIITPEFLESHFCLCELGAAWIKKSSILPIALHPKKQRALDSTPYRSVFQVLPLNSSDDLMSLGDAFADKGGFEKPKIISLKSRAKKLWKNTIQQYLEEMNDRKVVTPEEVAELRKQLDEAIEAYGEVEERASKLYEENILIRKLKSAEDLKAYDYAQLNEWEEFETAINNANSQLKKLPHVLPTVIYYYYADTDERFVGGQELTSDLKKEERAGRIEWDDGWLIAEEDRLIARTIKALDELKELMDELYQNEDFMERFDDEYENVRFDLKFTPFWEKVLQQTLYNSNL